MIKYKIQDKLFNFYALYYLLKMLFSEKGNHKSIEKKQNRELKKLIRNASKISLYKKKFEDAGLKFDEIKTIDDLKKIPPLTKAEYREWMQKESETLESKNFHFTHTSGSTGIPTINIFPPTEYAHHYMMDFYCWLRGGYNAFWGKTLTRQAGDNVVGTKSFIQKLGILKREIFNTKWDRNIIVNKINSYKPDFILANSSELVFIAEWIKANNIEICKPKYFCPNGENIDGLAEKILTETYGNGLINAYGCSEMASFAVKKTGETFYHLTESEVITLVKNETVSEVGVGELFVTPLYRSRFPLINYDIGDIVQLEYKNNRKIISKIEGRKNDTFVWKDGSITIYKNLENINSVLENIFQIRFIQTSDSTIKFQVVKDKDTTKTIEELESYLSDLYQKEFGNNVKIEYEWLSVIPPDPNGKIRNMISLLNKDN